MWSVWIAIAYFCEIIQKNRVQNVSITGLYPFDYANEYPAIFCGGVRLSSLSPDPILDQNMYPFSDLASKIHPVSNFADF